MPKKKIDTPNAIRRCLMDKGYTYSSWGRKHGYSQSHVSYAVRRYAGNGREPRGLKTYQILAKLMAEINPTT